LPDNYFTNTSIPKVQQPFWCGHHVLLAHSKAYHLAKSLGINGTVSFKTNGGYKIPLTNSSEDAIAVQRAWDFNEGWFANPTFINGDYPQYLKEFVSGFLPEFTDDEKSMINGTADIFAHDAYTSQFYFGKCFHHASSSEADLFQLPIPAFRLAPAIPLIPSTRLAPTQLTLTPTLTADGTSDPQPILFLRGSTKQQTGFHSSFITSKTPGSHLAVLQLLNLVLRNLLKC
jgi:hypothetical protein